MFKNLFHAAEAAAINQRIGLLTASSQPLWGKMSVDQMLAHCSVTYEMVYEDKYPKPSGLRKLMLKYLVKKLVVSEKPYKPNNPTAPQFIISGHRDFEAEQKRLTDFITRTQELGTAHFEGKESHSFGPLSQQEWNNMFYKHLDHHLKQFGV